MKHKNNIFYNVGNYITFHEVRIYLKSIGLMFYYTEYMVFDVIILLAVDIRRIRKISL